MVAQVTSSRGSVLQAAHNTTGSHLHRRVLGTSALFGNSSTPFIIAGGSGPWHTSVSIVAIEKIDWTDESGEISLLVIKLISKRKAEFRLLSWTKHSSCEAALVRQGTMKLTGFLLLAAGWVIVVAAVLLLPSARSRSAFAWAGIAVEVLGLVLALRSHRALDPEKS